MEITGLQQSRSFSALTQPETLNSRRVCSSLAPCYPLTPSERDNSRKAAVVAVGAMLAVLGAAWEAPERSLAAAAPSRL